MWKGYEGMLPKTQTPGKLGYYPVSNKKEWEDLPALYKVMEWSPVKDPHNKNQLRAVKSVIFDVVYMQPYGISAKVSVHPQEIQKILFCFYQKKDCQLYSVCGVELEGGTRLGAKWLQDSTTGAFGIYVGSTCVGRQGGFQGFVPDCVDRLPDGTFKFNFQHRNEHIVHYELSNPFRNEPDPVMPAEDIPDADIPDAEPEEDWDIEDEASIIPAAALPEGWNWTNYVDGSGHLESPEGKSYFSYDALAKVYGSRFVEYQETSDHRYDYFDYDGPETMSKFRAFAENIIKERYLQKESLDARISDATSRSGVTGELKNQMPRENER